MATVEVKKENKIAYITMNRPEKRNAMSFDLITELLVAFQDADQDKDIRVVIFSGAGKGFSAGGDLEALNSLDNTPEIMYYMKEALAIVRTIRQMDTYVVAAVHGHAAGAGFSLALAADFIVAEKQAIFVSSFSHIGLIPDLSLVKALTDKLPSAVVKEWLSAAKPVSAEEAMHWGLVNRVAKGDLLQEAAEFAQFIIDGPPLANKFVKQLVNHSDQLNDDTNDMQETTIQTLLLQSKDNKEGIRAFFEKRKPDFQGK